MVARRRGRRGCQIGGANRGDGATEDVRAEVTEDSREETNTEARVSPKKACEGGLIASQIPSQEVWRDHWI